MFRHVSSFRVALPTRLLGTLFFIYIFFFSDFGNFSRFLQKFQETKTNYEEFEAEFKNLQSELEKRQNDLKQELEKEKNVKPNVQKASGTNVRPMRRKRQGAKLPIVIKTGGLKSSQAKDGGTTNIIRQEDLGESDVQNKDEERTEDNSSEADISGNTGKKTSIYIKSPLPPPHLPPTHTN